MEHSYCLHALFSVVSWWSAKTEVWIWAPLFILHWSQLIISGIVGIVGVTIPRKAKALNKIGFAVCLSTLLSGIAFVVFPELTQADTFWDVHLSH